MVMLLDTDTGVARLIYPPTVKTTMRFPALTASRNDPVPESARVVTRTTVPPRPPVATFPNPSAPGKETTVLGGLQAPLDELLEVPVLPDELLLDVLRAPDELLLEVLGDPDELLLDVLEALDVALLDVPLLDVLEALDVALLDVLEAPDVPLLDALDSAEELVV
jgi:hypothetical protein